MPKAAWINFVDEVSKALRGWGAYLPLNETYPNENALTCSIGAGLRRLFCEHLPVDPDKQLEHHVTFRNGPTTADHRAWKEAQPDKWVCVHGVQFVPDVLVRRTLQPVTDVLPIEVKLVTSPNASQALATAIGQCFAYRTRYPQAILFIGVQPGVLQAGTGLRLSGDDSERCLHETLTQNGISLIMREVGG